MSEDADLLADTRFYQMKTHKEIHDAIERHKRDYQGGLESSTTAILHALNDRIQALDIAREENIDRVAELNFFPTRAFDYIQDLEDKR